MVLLSTNKILKYSPKKVPKFSFALNVKRITSLKMVKWLRGLHHSKFKCWKDDSGCWWRVVLLVQRGMQNADGQRKWRRRKASRLVKNWTAGSLYNAEPSLALHPCRSILKILFPLGTTVKRFLLLTNLFERRFPCFFVLRHSLR